jgi:hypothetical protein
MGQAIVFIVVILALVIFFRGEIQKIFPKNNDVSPKTEGEATNFLSIKPLEDLLGQDAPVILSIIGILLLTWIIGAVYTVFTKKTAKDALELGVSGWLIILVLFVFGIKQVFFEDGSLKQSPKTVKFELYEVQIGESLVRNMDLKLHSFSTYTKIKKRDKVTTNMACGQIMEPDWIRKSEETPQLHLAYDNPLPTNIDKYEITSEWKAFLAKNNVTRVSVKFTLVEVKVGVGGGCAHSTPAPWYKETKEEQ